MLKVGLTGGIASGKSVVGEMFVALGAHLIQADQIAHELMQPGQDVYKAVAEQFGLRLVEIKAKNNSRAIVYPRQIAMYLAKHLTEASLPEIGRQFGGKHHTTVLHSVDKIDESRKTDKDLNRLINKLTEQLGG